MAIGKVRYLNDDESVDIGKFGSMLPKNLQEKYIFLKKPFTINTVDDVSEGVLSIPLGNGLPNEWREKCEDLIIRMQLEGVTILIPPKKGEFPRDILPFAWGRKLSEVMVFLHMKDILETISQKTENENIKNIATTNFVIAGGEAENISALTYFLPLEVNHLAFFHSNLDELEEIQDYFFAKRGLPTEMFASPRNPTMSNADVVILCHHSTLAYEHILKENSIFIDIVGNSSVTKTITSQRPDVTVIDGFHYERNGQIFTSEEWEARIYNRHKKLRKYLTNREPSNRDIMFYIKNLNLQLNAISISGEVIAYKNT